MNEVLARCDDPASFRQRRTRVKLCGLTRPEDVDAAVLAGADAVGFVFHPLSPRAVTPEQAARLCRRLPPFVTAVGLFVDAEAALIEAALAVVPLDLLQFHGVESPGFCARFARRWIKALRMAPDLNLTAQAERYAGADGLLLDAWHPRLAGGTGRRFDWSRIPPGLGPRVVLAGGLDATNVAAAIAAVRPYGVDVSGGIESAPGIKDAVKIQAFLNEVRHGDDCRD